MFLHHIHLSNIHRKMIQFHPDYLHPEGFLSVQKIVEESTFLGNFSNQIRKLSATLTFYIVQKKNVHFFIETREVHILHNLNDGNYFMMLFIFYFPQITLIKLFIRFFIVFTLYHNIFIIIMDKDKTEKSAVKVFVRVRPLVGKESGSKEIVSVD